ncbi:autophagy-related 16-1 isoform X2, putative [Babesia ovis]|uniref:Autophagy-related 16-1 isoform X2, putative n=1 Tax=Babesia ovis TaxID=5869 RepID=A0A9W5TC25_BABOV|nr:autophagy-related 16-1 isoform X2, putative [Babesia ovis]
MMKAGTMGIKVEDDEIDQLEKEVRRRLGVVSGLLKLRDVKSKETYKTHFEKAKLEFDEISQYIAQVQEKVDRELALLHQVKGVVHANNLQQMVMKEVENQIQTSETLKVISELRNSATETRNRVLQKTGDAEVCVTATQADRPSTSGVGITERNDCPARSKLCNRVPGSYTKDRDTFNRYIL